MEITTNTIAELYIKQGYPEKAVDIYKAILELDPGNSAAAEKIEKLEGEMRGESGQINSSIEVVSAPTTESIDQLNATPEPSIEPVTAATMATESSTLDPVGRLENWLENIYRVRGLA